MKAVRESEIEGYFARQVAARGGESRKMVWVGRAHAPDRFVALNGVHLVELKRPGKDARDGQKREHNRLIERGADITVIDTFDDVDAFIRRITAMDDADIIARLKRGTSMFEIALLEMIERLQQDKRNLEIEKDYIAYGLPPPYDYTGDQ